MASNTADYGSLETATQTSDHETDTSGALGPQKYVAVVYHHVQYQAEPGPQLVFDLDDGKMIKDNPLMKPIPDYLALAILSTIFFIPFGIVAVDYSLKVRQASRKGEIASAEYASSWALQFALIAMATGPLFGLLLFLCIYLPNV